MPLSPKMVIGPLHLPGLPQSHFSQRPALASMMCRAALRALVLPKAGGPCHSAGRGHPVHNPTVPLPTQWLVGAERTCERTGESAHCGLRAGSMMEGQGLKPPWESTGQPFSASDLQPRPWPFPSQVPWTPPAQGVVVDVYAAADKSSWGSLGHRKWRQRVAVEREGKPGPGVTVSPEVSFQGCGEGTPACLPEVL